KTLDVPGPPFVNDWTSANSFMDPIEANKMTINEVGLIAGNVMFQNFWRLFAPSISAASYKDAGIFLRAFENWSILKAVPPHKAAIIITERAALALVVHGTGSPPITEMT